MSSSITYAGSAKRKRARLSTTTTQDIGHEPRSLKKQRTADKFDDEEVCDSEPERETSISNHRGDSLFHSPSVTQIGQEDEVEHSPERASREGTHQRSVILAEDANLQIIGEVDPASLSDDSDDEEDTIPVRELTDFVIYDLESRDLVPVGELLGLGYYGKSYGASGIVKPHKYREDDYDEDDEDDVLDGEEEVDDSLLDYDQYVELSKVERFDVHHVPSGKRKKVLDSKIYIKTNFAWYILAEPSVKYRPYFIGFWIQHRMLHLVVKAALKDARTSLAEFVASLEDTENTPNSIAIAQKMLGRELTAEDLNADDVQAYILGNLIDLRDAQVKIDGVPLIRALRGEPIPSFSSARRLTPGKRKSFQVQRLKNPEMEVLKHRNATVVTPIVNSIAEKLFHGLSAAGKVEHDEPDDELVADEPFMHRGNHSYIRWIGQPDEHGLYKQLKIDGVTYTVGDSVAVRPGFDEDKTRAANHNSRKAQTDNILANTMWFCRICFMYEDDEGNKLLHAQWYQHGSKMILQEVAHPQSLFLMDTCDPIDPATIVQKCNVRELAFDETEPAINVNGNENNFFTGFMFITRDSSLVSLSSSDVDDALLICENGKNCLACGLREQQNRLQEVSPRPPRTFVVRGVKYHRDDFVYILPPEREDNISGTYIIGQVTEVQAMAKPPTVTVRLFGRVDDVVRRQRRKADWHVPFSVDERRLFRTNETAKIDMENVDGKCYVRYLVDGAAIDDWVQHSNHFYSNHFAKSIQIKKISQLQDSANNITSCTPCVEERLRELDEARRLLQKHQPLRGLELFAGAGGLGTGFDKSGFVETRWAVEFSPSAALTYKSNHPNTEVYNQCSNVLLQDAIDARDGKKSVRPLDLHTGLALPSMPKRNEVDIIYGGPPCQSFSGANHHKKADDIRSTLICNMISYVEFYRPQYFLLENVFGLLHYKLMSRMIKQAFDPNQGIEMGILKFIVRSLTALGYQVRFKVCQAGQYGAPQGRKRVLFWGAKRGCPLPEFPMPTHAFKASNIHTLPDKTKILPPSRSLNPEDTHQWAPFNAVTITDAIGDLPPFDWKNPKQLIPKQSSNDKAEERARSQLLPSFDAVFTQNYSTYPGYTNEIEYAHPPLSRYQKTMREHIYAEKVSSHYTIRFNAGIVERVTYVPMEPGAFHDDLPKKLRSAVTSGSKKDRTFKGLYGRMDGEGFFKTAMTHVAPNQKGGDVLHPSQKRIVTVRECARAQGFPDHYRFLSVNEGHLKNVVLDQHRQIGNAVPVPLAVALGRSLGDALLKMWINNDRAGSPEA
ncbi:S-adenosyl-L-methionine-dependent methyltransferase [Athelia psychrophila]|uniref:Cytosine-specific methyltransferase n=1 Tax=Athelia psychrophila TaxID=1759441 RepID=A0A166JSI3_9AGAM|nr:S-adenosyl-L-methionine-dependent methyltransferase [Fibularhizoctonia sp. CBS 109695]